MGRAIVSSPSPPVVRQAFPEPAEKPPPAGSVAAQQQERPDTYRDRLFKYIPAEVVTLYVGLSAIVAATKDAPLFLNWVIFVAGFIGTPFYLRYRQGVTAPTQLIVSTAAFAVWVSALGGPFAQIAGYKPVYGAVLLPLFTFFVAGVSPPQPKVARQQA